MYIQKYYKVIRVIKDGDGGATPLYIENVSDSDGVFKLLKNSSPTYTPNLIYRIGDNGEWFEYDFTTLSSITVPSGSKIYFRGDNINGFNQTKSVNDFYAFTFSQNYNLGGYITSLLALDNFNTISDIPQYSFIRLFENQSKLLNVKDLKTSNIINVGNYGFNWCFYGCTSLTTAPTFENLTTVSGSGFSSCFYNCRDLTTAPSFDKVTTGSGFYNTFANCTSLTTAPTFENITTVSGNGFENCFYGCTSLTTAPSFDKVSTVGNSGFRGCFQHCTSLTTAPTFENLTTVSNQLFSSCFINCTSLTTTPNFSNVTKVEYEGFYNCFSGCTSLQVVYAPSIIAWSTSNFFNWLPNVSPTGVMYKPTGLEIPTGTSGVPEGWTTVDY